MPEPTVGLGEVFWALQDADGYSLSGCAVNDDADGVGGLVLEPSAGSSVDELDDADFSDWYDATTLERDEGPARMFGASGAAATSPGDASLELLGAVRLAAHGEVWFHDDGLSATPSRRSVFWTDGEPKPPFSVRTGVAIDSGVSTTSYAVYDPHLPAWVDSGVTRSAGAHSLRYAYWTVAQDVDVHHFAKVYLDARLVLDVHGVNDDWGHAALRSLVVHTEEAFRPVRIDRIRARADSALYASGSAVTPAARPASVLAWGPLIVSAEESAAGYAGEISLEFRWSSDGGAAWSVWAAATDEALAAVPCDGDGRDLIAFRASLSGGRSGLFTPRLLGISLAFEPGAEGLVPSLTARVPAEGRIARVP